MMGRGGGNCPGQGRKERIRSKKKSERDVRAQQEEKGGECPDRTGS